MKRSSIILIFIVLLALVSFKSSWIKNIEILTEKISRESILVDQFEEIKRKDYYMKVNLFKSGEFSLFKSEFFHETSMQLKSEIYLKDSIFLKYKDSGLEECYDEKSNSFYSKVFEKFYFFKSNKQGILKEREIRIASFNECNKAQIELKDMEFKIRNLTKEDFLKLKKELNALSNY